MALDRGETITASKSLRIPGSKCVKSSIESTVNNVGDLASKETVCEKVKH